MQEVKQANTKIIKVNAHLSSERAAPLPDVAERVSEQMMAVETDISVSLKKSLKTLQKWQQNAVVDKDCLKRAISQLEQKQTSVSQVEEMTKH